MVPAPFALNPAAATQNDILDFGVKLHKAHYSSAIRSLFTDKEEKFDVTEARLQEFLTLLKERTDSFNLSIVEMPLDLANPFANLVNFITNHGRFTHEQVRAFATTYIGVPNRAFQDDGMLYQCLLSSVTPESFGELSCSEEEYVVNSHKCGLLLLSFIVSESAADATIDPDTIRKELSHAPAKFKELKYNVEDFNSWVLLKIKQLRQHGEESSDLRAHLFSAYKSSEDKEFVSYINALKDDMRDNRTAYRPKQLMSKAKLKSEELDKDRKFDNLDSEGANDILALKAEMYEQAKQISYLTGKVSANGGTKPGARAKKRGSGTPFPAELKDADPPADPTKPKNIGGVDYWYCTTHNAWGAHSTMACKKSSFVSCEVSLS